MTISKIILLHASLTILAGACAQDDAACATPEFSSGVTGHAMLQAKRQNTEALHLSEEEDKVLHPVLSMVDIDSSKYLDAMTDRSKVMRASSMYEGRPVFLGSLEPLDDKGFQVVANTCCHLEMELFIRRVVAGLQLTICDEGALMSLLPGYTTCTTGKTNYTTLLGHLIAAKPPNPCAFLAPAGACPVARGPECVHDPAPASHRRRQCSARIQKGASGQCQLPAGGAWCEVRLKNLPPYWMAVYDWDVSEDWVSYNICQAGFWEESDIAQFGKPGHMLDIGGNIGYHTFAFAQGGWTVSTFEPMTPNLALIQATMCRNPALAAKITLNSHGLGTTNQQCTMTSPMNNVGDGHTQCATGGVMPTIRPGFKEIGHFNVRRLDEVLAEQKIANVDLVKIDVEGFEKQVFTGAPNFLARYHPRLIMSEVWIKMVGDESPTSGIDYLDLFEKAGYKFYEDNACKLPVDGKTKLRTHGGMDIVMCK